LIDSSKPAFADSALFLFFQGRVDRLKVKEIDIQKLLSLFFNKKIRMQNK